MPKELIKRYTPDRETLKSHKYLRIFGRLLHDANLWHFNKRSVSGAFAVGLFWAMIPIPMQMVAAAATAIAARVNLPLSVALVWLTNPLTMPPIFYFCYLVGTWTLPSQEPIGDFELSMEWIANSIERIWQPLYLGSFLMGVVLALIGYFGMRMFWRHHTLKRWHKRQRARRSSSTPSVN